MTSSTRKFFNSNLEQTNFGDNDLFGKRITNIRYITQNSLTDFPVDILVAGVTLDPAERDVKIGETASLSAVLNPETVKTEITWSSDDESIAMVSAEGVVTGVSAGVTSVTAQVKGGAAKASCKVRVLFKDVENGEKYFFEPVYWALDQGITTGYKKADGTSEIFGVGENCTREQIVTFLWRLKGSPEPEKEAEFTDLDPSKYYFKAVSWAAENKITTGVSDTEFGVGKPCTRAMCVTFLYRAAGEPKVEASGEGFTDVEEGKYYTDAVAWAAACEITTGYKDEEGKPTGEFGVKDDCLREQIVTFLDRFAKVTTE